MSDHVDVEDVQELDVEAAGSRVFRALAALQGDYKPTLFKRAPRFKPSRQPACWEDVRVPAFDWTHPAAQTCDHLRVLDVNGAFLAPLSGTELAHNALTRTGPHDGASRLDPGFYLVTVRDWWDDRMPHPLGTGDLARPGRKVWLCHPTVVLLQELMKRGFYGELTITDSWTCPDRVRPVAWANHLRDTRAGALLTRDDALYQAVKRGYGQAVVVMISGKVKRNGEYQEAPMHRPDWGRAIQAQHMANTWRKLWSSVEAGHGPVRWTETDEVTWDRDALAALQAGPKPLKYDDTRLQLGAFSLKARFDWTPESGIDSWERP